MEMFWCKIFGGRCISHSLEKLCRFSSVKSAQLRLSSSSSQHSPLPQPEIEPPGKLKAFIVKKYVNYLEKFDASFGQKYPMVYKCFIVLSGIRDFFVDTRMYYGVATDIWSGRPLGTFTRKELQTYQQLPGDMIRSAPVLISVPLPFAPYVVFPLAYLFPRQLLCRLFWTPQQRLEFAQDDLMHRFVRYSKILNYLEAHSMRIRDVSKRKIFTDILYQKEVTIREEKRPDGTVVTTTTTRERSKSALVRSRVDSRGARAKKNKTKQRRHRQHRNHPGTLPGPLPGSGEADVEEEAGNNMIADVEDHIPPAVTIVDMAEAPLSSDQTDAAVIPGVEPDVADLLAAASQGES